ncbi:nuclear transport factor 2 family protein [Micromonospora sp. STR1s_5]|nr:nuclear transport factor 2 family protein [Micromonospora sp. STR1s_5]
MTPTDPSAGNPAVDLARRFLDGLQAMDIDAALACFARDAVQEMPFAPPGFPSRLDGIDALRRQYGGLPDAYASMRFDITAILPMEDPQWALLEYHGTIAQRDGSRYDNDYAGLFHVADGAIVLFREYFNPLVLQAAFGGDKLDATFSLPSQQDATAQQ